MTDDTQAYVAVRPDGFVDGACLALSDDAQSWCRNMRRAGMTIERRPCGEAAALLFSYPNGGVSSS